MKKYLVGGAVRDELLGLPVTEHDWVVVESTPEEMLNLGFKPVGKDFPVFLHPETKDEYALARTERKVGAGYKGFVFYAATDVTLEEDLKRRDLTINAIAKDEDGKIIDPFAGRSDLKNKVLRHVSDAFVEDPVRILRVARFAARFGDFTIAAETMNLMREMVNNGEINALVAERVWQECARALMTEFPERFFSVLSECDALTKLFPELIENVKGLEALKIAANQTMPLEIRFAALTYAIPKEKIKTLAERYRIPSHITELSILVSNNYFLHENSLALSAEEILKLLESCDAYRRPERFSNFLLTCDVIDYHEHFPSKKSQRLELAYNLSKSIDTAMLIQKGIEGEALGKMIREERLKIIKGGQ